LIKLFAILSALVFSLILIPAYADIVSLSMEKSAYTNDEMITFVGKETEGKKSVFVIIRDPVGDFIGMVSDPASDNNGNFVTIPKNVSLFFKSTGIYTATAFTSDQTEEEGLTINLRYDGDKVTPFKGHKSSKIQEVRINVRFSSPVIEQFCETDESVTGHLIFNLTVWKNGKQNSHLNYHLNLFDENGFKVGTLQWSTHDILSNGVDGSPIVGQGNYMLHCFGQKPVQNQHSGFTIDRNGNFHFRHS